VAVCPSAHRKGYRIMMTIGLDLDRDLDLDRIQNVDELNTHVDGVTCPERWQPSGYVNAYRLPPYEYADIFERLTSVACWSNELNEMAHRTLVNIFFLLALSIGIPLIFALSTVLEGLR
jgi:hypothetical protein